MSNRSVCAECCFISGHDLQYAVRNECEAIVNFDNDPTASCPNHHLQMFGGSGSTTLFTFGPGGINAPNQAGCDRTAGQWTGGQIAIEPTACVTLEDAGWTNVGINDFAIVRWRCFLRLVALPVSLTLKASLS